MEELLQWMEYYRTEDMKWLSQAFIHEKETVCD